MPTPSVQQTFQAIEDERGWDRLFREIKERASEYTFECKIAKLRHNKPRNRYGDVSPFDHTRIKLIEGPNDYINSNLLEMKKADRSYILSQGPLPNTSGHMWQMVWEQQSKAVVMLNKTIEKGARKCDQYWPTEVETSIRFDEVHFEVTLVSEESNPNFVIRKLKLRKTNSNEPRRTIFQFHYTAWPDFGVPESPTAFLDFLACVQDHGVLDKNVGPAVVHCSAGIGRSGTFSLIDLCYVYLKKGISFDIKDTLLTMRTYRMGLIQTAAQLRFSYLAIAHCEQMILKERSNKTENAKEILDDEEDDDSSNTLSDRDKYNVSKKGKLPESGERKRGGEPNGPNEKKGKYESDEHLMIESQGNPIPDHGLDSSKNDLRHRYIVDKKTALKQKVDELKSNMRANEEKRNKFPWKNYLLGGLLATAVVGILIRAWWQRS